jgi:hypothetical protein
VKTIDLATARQGIDLTKLMNTPDSGRQKAKVGAASRNGSKTARAARVAAEKITGPFVHPADLTAAERLDLIDGIEAIIEGIYTHLPLKMARYGFDPVQRLRLLRSRAEELTVDEFHAELAEIITNLRDAHTRYVGPSDISGRVAVLPFLVEMVGPTKGARYIVSKVETGLPSAFKPGAEVVYWNGVPIDTAVQRHSEREVGGRPDTQRAWATQSLTLRALGYGPPPDEQWVVVGYHPAGAKAGDQVKEARFDWRVIEPGSVGKKAKPRSMSADAHDPQRAMALDPAAEAIRLAKVMLFRPDVLTGNKADAPRPAPKASRHPKPSILKSVPTRLRTTLKAAELDLPGGPYGYLRIYAFDALPGPFIDELTRLLDLLPDRGLIIDLRSNPGGYIWSAEMALQLFTPNHIDPTRFAVLATDFTRTLAHDPAMATELAPWKASLDEAVRSGERYSQPIPITDPDACNEFGQRYGGPVVLIADSTTYSAGDLFTAGFVDNAVGAFICTGTATGAGGANVSDYESVRNGLSSSPEIHLPVLPHGIGFTFAYRRATRSGPSEGLPIEDVGITGVTHPLTSDDLLGDNEALLTHCAGLLEQTPFTRLKTSVKKRERAITVTSTGLDRIDMTVDGRPFLSTLVVDGQDTVLSYEAGAGVVQLDGWRSDTVRQHRRLFL